MSSRLPNLSGAAGNPIQTMSSREIAELTGKEHKNVIRDIRTMLEDLAGDGSDLSHVQEDKDVRGYTSAFHLDRELTETLLTGYSATLRRAVIRRWQELEEAVKYTVARMSPRTDVTRECRLSMAQHLKMAKMAGLTGNQALIAANRATAAMTGINPLGLMGITHMTAPQNEALLTPTEIGRRAGGYSAQMVNLLLCTIRFQEGHRDNKGSLYYEPTEEGIAAGGVMQDTGKKHSNGVPIRQLKWSSAIVTVVADALRSDPVD